LKLHRVGTTTIRNIERGVDRQLEAHERQAIADACGIDPLFFEVDLSDEAAALGEDEVRHA
jgi:hypothetical protein